METYIKANISCNKDNLTTVIDFFRAAEEFDTKQMITIYDCIESGDSDLLQGLLNDHIYRGYLEGIEVAPQKESVTIDATCGSGGFEFLMELIKLFGPCSININATYEHDEDPSDEGDWPLKIKHKDGVTLINGKEYIEETEFDEDAPYQEITFEIVGPKLNESQLAPLKDECKKQLLKVSSLEGYLNAFEVICYLLVKLEAEHNSGLEIHEENALEFTDLYKIHGTLLEKSSIDQYLCEYYRQVIKNISEEEHLGTCIKRFDEAYDLSSMLIGMLEVEGVDEVLEGTVDSQESFLIWKDYIVMLAAEGDDDMGD